MKGLILAGGTGSRLRPITHTGPKQLVPIVNKPILKYCIEDLIEAGIDDIGVVLGNRGYEEIQNYLGDGSDHGVDITYILQGDPLGLAHAIGCAKDFVGGDPFVVYLGDNLTGEGITDLVSEFNPVDSACCIGLQKVDQPSEYGVVDVDEYGNVRRLVEKPDDPPSNLALTGIYGFTPAIFEQIEKLQPSWRGEYEITEAIQGLLDDGFDIQSHIVDGWWKDTGQPKDVLHANRLVLDDIETDIAGSIEDEKTVQGRIKLGANSVVEEGAIIRGPVSIGADTHIAADTYVGPYTSIGDACDISSTHIESSLVMSNSEITTNRTIVDSLIGPKVTIESNDDEQPEGSRLVVGQNSSLKL